MDTTANTKEKLQEPFPSSMTAIAAGLILAVIGSIMVATGTKAQQ